VVGAVGGVALFGVLSGLLVAAVGGIPFTPGDFPMLTDAGIVTLVSVTVTWSATLLWVLVVSRRQEVDLVA
jgi:hypothetical protein